MAAREHASCFAFTQLAPPSPAAAWMERPHLLQYLSASRIAVLCAPPGYGKTTLAAQFAARQPACGWLTLGPEATDTTRLLHALWRAWLGEELPAERVAAAEAADAASTLAHMADRLAASPHPRLLVLDAADGCDSAVRAALRRFAQNLPGHLRLLLTLRCDQDWQWHAIYISPAACRLSFHDLQWRADEVDRWLQQRGLSMTPATREWLGQWPAAIALWLHADGTWQERPSARGALLDYCLQERVHSLPAAARNVLFHFAVIGPCPLERACAQLGEGGHTLITCLLDAALASVEGVGARACLHIPPLIQDAVKHHLALHEPGQLRCLYGLAAREACRQGRPAHALRAAVQAGDLEQCTELLHQTGWDLLHDGQTATVQDAVLLLEGQLSALAVDSLLLYLQAQLRDSKRPWGLVSPVRWEQLLHSVRLAGEQSSWKPEQRARFDAGLNCIRLQRALHIADLALARELESCLREENLPDCLQALALDIKGELYLLQGRPSEAAACMARALHLARLSGHRHHACWLAHRLAEAESARGQLQRASILREEALAFAWREDLHDSLAMEVLLCGHVEICLAMHRMPEAEAALHQLLQGGDPPAVLVDVLCHQCYRARPDNSDWQASIARLCRLDPCALPPALRVRLEQVLLDVWMAAGDRDRVQLWLGLLPPLVEAGHGIAQFDGRNRLRAMAWLGRKQAFATLAGTLQQQASQLPADLALLRALQWEHGLDDGRSDWLPALASCGLLAELRRLERQCPQRWARIAAAGEAPLLPQQSPQLDGKDRLLLQYLEQGWSNEWIAEHMHLAMGTVKNRLTLIYRRLGVHNRAQAVHWWRFHGEQG